MRVARPWPWTHRALGCPFVELFEPYLNKAPSILPQRFLFPVPSSSSFPLQDKELFHVWVAFILLISPHTPHPHPKVRSKAIAFLFYLPLPKEKNHF